MKADYLVTLTFILKIVVFDFVVTRGIGVSQSHLVLLYSRCLLLFKTSLRYML